MWLTWAEDCLHFRKVKHRLGVSFPRQKKEQVVTFQQRALPGGGIAPAICLPCHLAWTSFMCPRLHISSRLGPVLQTNKGPLRGSHAITNLKHAPCIESYEYFTILMKVQYINTLHIFCSTHSLIRARLLLSIVAHQSLNKLNTRYQILASDSVMLAGCHRSSSGLHGDLPAL